jgi:benzoate membrane transport protein
VLLGLTSQAVVAAAQAAPPGLFAGLAGVALLGSLGSAASQALEVPADRLAAITTLAVAASGVQIGGIGSAFWALVAGGVLTALTRRAGRLRPAAAGSPSRPTPGAGR